VIVLHKLVLHVICFLVLVVLLKKAKPIIRLAFLYLSVQGLDVVQCRIEHDFFSVVKLNPALRAVTILPLNSPVVFNIGNYCKILWVRHKVSQEDKVIFQ